MTAIWSVDTEAFYQNAVNVRNEQPIMAVVKNNAYHYGLEFAVKQFLKAGINTFSTTSLKEAVRVREIAPHATIFLMNAVYDFDTVREYQIHDPSLFSILLRVQRGFKRYSCSFRV